MKTRQTTKNLAYFVEMFLEELATTPSSELSMILVEAIVMLDSIEFMRTNVFSLIANKLYPLGALTTT
mgnify:CR=1 FL=1